ncbi:MAG: DUF899 family protein [Gammaproteobacteria bacterium]|nr:DUF899 family protein [Gammaproteobacteria bacterium]NNF61175.1 DUF899 family protein [Gammaproteobacteria bacterium]NNM19870.1 DUF899 family protein [Gammaproteobacteria bacterium]
MGRFHDYRFPNESDAYRAARDDLLAAETELRRQVERVAAQRRALPAGGSVAEDYHFAGADGAVAMSELFVAPRDTLVIYSFMFPPGKSPCPMCTSMLDGLNGNAPQVMQRVNLAVVARATIAQLTAFAASRGWHNLPLYSTGPGSYSRDYLGENAQGTQMPMLNVFSRHDGAIVHRYGTELMVADAEPGQDPRHVDPVWPLWNLLDFTPDGRGEGYPQVL